MLFAMGLLLATPGTAAAATGGPVAADPVAAGPVAGPVVAGPGAAHADAPAPAVGADEQPSSHAFTGARIIGWVVLGAVTLALGVDMLRVPERRR